MSNTKLSRNAVTAKADSRKKDQKVQSGAYDTGAMLTKAG